MKRFAIIVLFTLLFCSCTVDREKYGPVTVRLINHTEQTLIFSIIDNGGDSRFYPVDRFTLNPGEEYSQTQNHIGSYEPVIIATKLEGKSPLNKIGNGFAYVSDSNNKGLKSAKDVSVGDELTISLKDGIIKSQISDIKERV